MQLCWCVVAVVIWQASGQAPGDGDGTCSTGQNSVRHIFPDDWQRVFDSYNYGSLFTANRWSAVDFDADRSTGVSQTFCNVMLFVWALIERLVNTHCKPPNSECDMSGMI
jgi:hypothetical protein